MMKKNVLLLLLLSLFINSNLFAQAQIPNGDFESWTDSLVCTSWKGVELNLGVVTAYSLQRTSDAHSGSFAANVYTTYVAMASVTIPGVATLGTVNVMTQNVDGGIPFTDKPSKISGYYKYAPGTGDDGNIIAMLFKTTAGVRDTIGAAIFSFNTATNGYTYFEAAFDYGTTPPTTLPDTMNIVALASGFSPVDGSSLKIDDLQFTYIPTSVDEDEQSHVAVFPNPANSQITLAGISESKQISFYDQSGRIVKSIAPEGKAVYTLDVSDLPVGIYFMVSVQEDGSLLRKKVIVRR